ncbi:hypothetical protein XH91_27215 [Bradyrhizobium guangzhouense]|nr:hypothetical protein XH91_27215 [Bradyrhizobium guangzhouense]
MNNKIGALEAAKAPAQELNVDETRQALAALQKRFDEIQSGQTSLSGQVSELKGQVAKEQGERKLLSDQLGSLSERVDALSSSSADANAGSQQPQRNRRSKR